MRFWVSFSMMGRVVPCDKVLDFERWDLFPCLITMLLLFGDDGDSACPLHAPASIGYDKGGCAIYADDRDFTAPDVGDGGCHRSGYLVEMGNNGDAGNKGERGNGAPELWEVEEYRAHHHCARGTARDHAALPVYLLNGLPHRRALELFQQICRFTA